jgi:hypothetical protein
MRTVSVTQGLLDWAFAWRRKRTLLARDVLELPRVLMPGIVYIIGENGHRWAAAFRCPCGCRDTVQLNLLPERRPRWSVTIGKNKAVSLSPSVWRKVGCHSHFVVRQGRIQWCQVA